MEQRPEHHPLCDFITQLKYSDLPDEVAEKAALCILDTLGALVVGLPTPVSLIASNYASSVWQSGPSTIFASGERRVAIAAAFANAVAAKAVRSVGDAADPSHRSRRQGEAPASSREPMPAVR